ncbi:protein arginine kinase [Natranaerobius thermophilus]|uniref:Protein-arginine kinase n=1 Tax=Natranaerobius thermophilus (strain ATCC BAA-1301 / DSM 18059 / JW/NM-WN-LF) TaxID=457570 RepID=B2A490_NATTJ|nr:protein arginine kinase [Natranaerobius thermophilus]ACB83744.1 response regulator receiver protein [Natranaerobius thermophilus JW/NM-WN-LF]
MLDKYIRETGAKWMEGEGPHHNIVLSSRIRLARNFREVPFPSLAGDEETEQVINSVQESLKRGESGLGRPKTIKMKDLSSIDKQVMVEKHLISPLLAKEDRNSAVILSQDEDISIMLNEEDHIRIQCLFPGLQLEKAFEMADHIDDLIEESVDYAFDEELGFMTACPTNVGTGMRASVMLHLPALAITGQINRILSAVGQVGLAVRGLYGEGSEVVGNIFQISNQITLGQSEQDMIENLLGVTKQIVEQEEQARKKLEEDSELKVADKAGRSFGQLSYARIVTTKEALDLLSQVRLGVDMGLLKEVDATILDDLMVLIRPANLQKIAGKELESGERDTKRAEIIQKRINMNTDKQE